MSDQNPINFIIGGDPEFPLIDLQTNKYISLVPYINGTKEEKHPIPVELCFQQIDNTNIEFDIPPQKYFYMYHHLVDLCIESTNNFLQNINPNFSLTAVSSALYDDKELESDEAKEFGCEPSLNIYDKIQAPKVIIESNYRFAGYHLHFGFDRNLTKKEVRNFIVLCDVFLGLQALSLDNDGIRRQYYGKLGEYRQKAKNRLEYRVLGAKMHLYPDIIGQAINKIHNYMNNFDPKIFNKAFRILSEYKLTNDKELIFLLKKELKSKGIYEYEV